MVEPPPEFKELVKDALTHLYDVGHLQTHPLAASLDFRDETSGAGGKARALRQMLFNAIDALKPAGTGSLRTRSQRSYKLLYLRYIEGIKAQEAALQLALSDRQYFRELEKAVDEVAQLLWDGVSVIHSEPDEQYTVTSEALRISQQEKERWFDLWEVIQGLADDLRPMLDERRVSITLQPGGPGRIPIYTNRTLLRQLLLHLILKITLIYPGSQLEIHCDECPESVTVGIQISDAEAGSLNPLDVRQELDVRLLSSDDFNGLLGVTQASLSVLPGEQNTVALVLPTSRWNILIVDDNNATLRLFRRYLANENCRIFEAASVNKAIQFLKQTSVTVHLILMDVMMPNQDGWEGLQKIRAHPRSQDIPVVICSVLKQPDLAFSLGAAGFLAKPVEQKDLLQVIHQFLYTGETG